MIIVESNLKENIEIRDTEIQRAWDATNNEIRHLERWIPSFIVYIVYMMYI